MTTDATALPVTAATMNDFHVIRCTQLVGFKWGMQHWRDIVLARNFNIRGLLEALLREARARLVARFCWWVLDQKCFF